MSGSIWLDTLLLTISLFDVIIMLWLGSTILLNAEKRTWGVYFAASGLFFGAVFFISHAAILGLTIPVFSTSLNFWWHIAWVPVVAAPFAWYIVMLWYSGFWETGQSSLYRRQNPWLWITVVYVIALVILLVFVNPVSTLGASARLDYGNEPVFTGIPFLFIAYPVYIFLCILLSIDALIHPGPTSRYAGDAARQKARPFLIGAGMMLLGVSLLVGFSIFYVLQSSESSPMLLELYAKIALPLTWLDLLLSILVTSAVLLTGQAVVSYEVFSGKSLPLEGFKREYRRVIVFASFLAILAAVTIKVDIHPIYMVLAIIALSGMIFSITSWRSYHDREALIKQLSTFIGESPLDGQLHQHEKTVLDSIEASFILLCRDILLSKKAILTIPPQSNISECLSIRYPVTEEGPEFDIPTGPVQNGDKNFIPYSGQGYEWLIQLVSESGIYGRLLLGEKMDGGLYTLEEMEVARSTTERLLTQVHRLILARRLIELQQNRLVKEAVLAQQPGRVLHDDILPRIHAVLLRLSASKSSASLSKEVNELSMIHGLISSLLRSMPKPDMIQLGESSVFDKLKTEIQTKLMSADDRLMWEVDEAASVCVEKMPDLERDAFFYSSRELIRNAFVHGRSLGKDLEVSITAGFDEKVIWLKVTDNGPGFSGRKMDDGETYPGTGQGLELHKTILELLGGSIQVIPEADGFSALMKLQSPANKLS